MAADRDGLNGSLGLNRIEAEGARSACEVAQRQFDELRRKGEIVDLHALARFGPSVVAQYLLIADKAAARALAAKAPIEAPPIAAKPAAAPPRQPAAARKPAAHSATLARQSGAASKRKALAPPSARMSKPTTKSEPAQRIPRIKTGWAEKRRVKLDALTEAMRDGGLVLLGLAGVIFAALRLFPVNG